MPKKPTKKEIDAFIKENSVFPEGAIPPEYFDVLAYYDRMDDLDNFSLERWYYLGETWTLEIYRIYEETGFDGSYYFKSLMSDLKKHCEVHIEALIDHWKNHFQEMPPSMRRWDSISTKEEFDKVFPNFGKEEKNVKQQFSQKEYYSFLEKKESDSFTPDKYSETERLISKGNSIRVHRRNWMNHHKMDEHLPQIYKTLKIDRRISENEIISILTPPSKYYLKSLMDRITHHFNHPVGEHYSKRNKVVEKKDVNGDKIFLVEPK